MSRLPRPTAWKAAACAIALAGTALAAGQVPADAVTPSTPNDPMLSQQWGLPMIKAPQAWATSTGVGVTVAVVDTGVDLGHPDLVNQLVPGTTVTSCPAGSPVDAQSGVTTCGNGDWKGVDGVGQTEDRHGTHVAGIVAAQTNNGLGVAGTAPDVKIMPVKVLENGSGSYDSISAGIRWAVAHGADVITMSLGGLPGTETVGSTGLVGDLDGAVQYATSHGVIVTAAAGNSTYPLCSKPANSPGAMCVTAVDDKGAPSYFTNGGLSSSLNAVAAPGGDGTYSCADDILSTVPVGTGTHLYAVAASPTQLTGPMCGGDDYDTMAGTSMATPFVAGVASLLRAQCRTPQNVMDVLQSTAVNPVTGVRGVFTPEYGHGVVDAAAAVAAPGAGGGTCP